MSTKTNIICKQKLRVLIELRCRTVHKILDFHIKTRNLRNELPSDVLKGFYEFFELICLRKHKNLYRTDKLNDWDSLFVKITRIALSAIQQLLNRIVTTHGSNKNYRKMKVSVKKNLALSRTRIHFSCVFLCQNVNKRKLVMIQKLHNAI